MENYDAIIVGGGPAGSSCAWALKRAGLYVLILDKSPFPRDKVCAGWITPEVVRELALDIEDYQQRYTLQPFTGFRTGLLGSAMINTDYGQTVSYGILRREFDDYLLKRSGAKYRLGEALTSLDFHRGNWLVNERLQAPLLIGAGGHFCPVARRLNPKAADGREIVTAQEVEFEMNLAQLARCGVQADTPELYFLPELDGYGWCVRKGDSLNIGLGRTDNRHLARHVAQFHEFLAGQGKAPAEMPARFRGHAYRLACHRKQRRIVDDGVMLIGDAAGLAYPQSGEGIYTAVKSGLLAAATVLDARNDYRMANLESYSTRLDQFFDDKTVLANISLPNVLKSFMAQRLLKNRYFSRHILLDKWFLHQGAVSSLKKVG
jgi:geranylgeranyl reductase family protein